MSLQQYIEVQFSVMLVWKDHRIEYQNLKDSYKDNILSDIEATELWKPKLILTNSLQRIELQYVTSTEATIPRVSSISFERKGPYHETPLSQSDEGRVYESEMIEIWLATHHLLKFDCQFTLTYFPFDKQICYIKASTSYQCWQISFFHKTRHSNYTIYAKLREVWLFRCWASQTKEGR